MSRVVRNNRFVVPLPAEEHKCSKRRDQKCKTLWGGYADDPGTDGARHWAKWRGDRAEATGQRARPKADGQSCTLATPRGSSIRVPIGRLSPEAFSRHTSPRTPFLNDGCFFPSFFPRTSFALTATRRTSSKAARAPGCGGVWRSRTCISSSPIPRPTASSKACYAHHHSFILTAPMSQSSAGRGGRRPHTFNFRHTSLTRADRVSNP